MFNITFKSNTSSSLVAFKTDVGFLIREGEHVTLMCFAASEVWLNVSWSVETIEGERFFNNTRFTVGHDGKHWYSSLILKNFDYHDCGTYSCKVDAHGSSKQLLLPLAIDGTC